MAKQMVYTTPDGVEHEESYWRIVQVNLNYDGSGLLVFLGYHNKAARDDHRVPIANKQYPLDQEKFVQFFKLDKLVDGANILSQSYTLALTTLDTDLDENQENGRSFFDGAINV